MSAIRYFWEALRNLALWYYELLTDAHGYRWLARRAIQILWDQAAHPIYYTRPDVQDRVLTRLKKLANL